jgi:hypothetical protein
MIANRMKTGHLKPVPFMTFPFGSAKGNTERIARDVEAAQTGDHVELWRGEWLGSSDTATWRPHPHGFVLSEEDGNVYTLNGEKRIAALGSSQMDEDWAACADGVVHMSRSAASDRQRFRLYLNGSTVLMEDELPCLNGSLHAHPKGVLLVRQVSNDAYTYHLNGVRICEGPFRHWHMHEDGVVVLEGARLLLNGIKHLAMVPEGVGRKCFVNRHGLFTWTRQEVLLNGKHFCSRLPTYDDAIFHGRNIIESASREYVVLNGARPLFARNFLSMRWHPNGILVGTVRELTLIVVKPEKPFNPDAILCD